MNHTLNQERRLGGSRSELHLSSPSLVPSLADDDEDNDENNDHGSQADDRLSAKDTDISKDFEDLKKFVEETQSKSKSKLDEATSDGGGGSGSGGGGLEDSLETGEEGEVGEGEGGRTARQGSGFETGIIGMGSLNHIHNIRPTMLLINHLGFTFSFGCLIFQFIK